MFRMYEAPFLFLIDLACALIAVDLFYVDGGTTPLILAMMLFAAGFGVLLYGHRKKDESTEE